MPAVDVRLDIGMCGEIVLAPDVCIEHRIGEAEVLLIGETRKAVGGYLVGKLPGQAEGIAAARLRGVRFGRRPMPRPPETMMSAPSRSTISPAASSIVSRMHVRMSSGAT